MTRHGKVSRCTLYFEAAVQAAEERDLRRLVEAWYEVGVWGGFGPVEHGKGVLHLLGSIEVKNDGEPRVEWWVDMGSASMNALGALMLCLQTWSRETDVALRKVVFGEHEGFTAGPCRFRSLRAEGAERPSEVVTIHGPWPGSHLSSR